MRVGSEIVNGSTIAAARSGSHTGVTRAVGVGLGAVGVGRLVGLAVGRTRAVAVGVGRGRTLGRAVGVAVGRGRVWAIACGTSPKTERMIPKQTARIHR